MKVIVAVDQTDFANQIVDTVISYHWPQDTQFKILSVVESLNWEAVACIEWNREAAKIQEHRKQLANEIAMNARRRIATAIPGSVVHVEIRTGHPKEEIISSATEWMADRIILGAHGHAPNRFFTGSVARAVSQYCGCTVQLVRLKAPATKHKETKASISKMALS